MRPPLDRLAVQFTEWYGHKRRHSPVYEALVGALAQDEDALDLLGEVWDRPYVHYLFMGAVHYLLLEGKDHPLRSYYGTVVNAPQSPDDAYPAFRDFCFSYRDEIVALVATHQVQINDARRCAPFLLALAHVVREDPNRQVALVEVGAAAGLTLLIDRFSYDFSPVGRVGRLDAPLCITCEPRGRAMPPVPLALPRIGWRVGLDPSPIDVTDSHATNWLVALCAPDDVARLAVLRSALAEAASHPSELVVGTASQALPCVLARVPKDAVLCVGHAFTTHHFTDVELTDFERLLSDAGRTRDLHVVSMEWERSRAQNPDFQKPVALRLTSFQVDGRTDSVLGRLDPRGGCEWIEWLAG